jgi:hypothetical protein
MTTTTDTAPTITAPTTPAELADRLAPLSILVDVDGDAITLRGKYASTRDASLTVATFGGCLRYLASVTYSHAVEADKCSESGDLRRAAREFEQAAKFAAVIGHDPASYAAHGKHLRAVCADRKLRAIVAWRAAIRTAIAARCDGDTITDGGQVATGGGVRWGRVSASYGPQTIKCNWRSDKRGESETETGLAYGWDYDSSSDPLHYSEAADKIARNMRRHRAAACALVIGEAATEAAWKAEREALAATVAPYGLECEYGRATGDGCRVENDGDEYTVRLTGLSAAQAAALLGFALTVAPEALAVTPERGEDI